MNANWDGYDPVTVLRERAMIAEHGGLSRENTTSLPQGAADEIDGLPESVNASLAHQYRFVGSKPFPSA